LAKQGNRLIYYHFRKNINRGEIVDCWTEPDLVLQLDDSGYILVSQGTVDLADISSLISGLEMLEQELINRMNDDY